VLPLVAVTSFLVHTQLMGAALSPAEGFTALTLFQILRYPLTDLPSSIDMLMHALTSLSRIENFLQLPEVTGLRLEHQHDTAVVVKCADFGWPSRRFDAGADEYDECACYGPPKYRIVSSGDDPDVERGNPSEGVVILKDVRIQIKKASFTVICAMTGAGKSTLLAGLLGECRISQGSAQLSDEGGIFLCTQSSYIQSGTLRENILFGSEFNESRYRHVLFCCALDKDMIALPDGDMTEIGEKGVNLSGGQQQRVNLARAAYSSMSTVLLDDPLSALDAAVAEHLVRHLLCGFLKGRTRVLVTHQLSLTLPVCHSVIFINQRGHVKQCASVGLDSIDDLRDTNPVTKSFVKMIKDAKNGPIISAVNAGEEFYRGELASVKSGGCSDQLIHLETKAVGGVLAHVYLYYAQACGGPLVLGLIVSISFAVSIMELTQNGFLGRWMTQMERGDVDASSSLRFYLITVCVSISAEVFSAFYKARVSMFAAKCIHDALVCRLLKAPLSWFESTPVGRIQNRLSSDINTVDNELMGSLVHFVGCFLGNLQVVLCIGLTLPFLLLCFIPIVGVTSWIAYQYLVTSRELKRLESISRSPVLTAFAETLLGLPTIRASCHQSRYMKDIIQRIDAFNRCHLYLWLSNRWLNIRMCILGSAVVGCVGLAVVCGGFRLSGGAAGLVLVYSLTFTESLTWIARTHAESQMNLNSVERIKEYSFVEQENHEGIKEVSGSLLGEECDSPEGKIPNLALATERACRGWPMLGAIEFRAVCLSYNTRANVLKGVSFRAEGGMKVGIVGRTGAGKSSILSALFRIVEPTSGQIIVDGVNLLTIPLHELRSNIAIVSQEPILFAGSVRFNLDPYDEKSDLTLWAALKKVKMNDYVASFMPGENLTDKMINEKGGNLSAGQKQLLCLARAIVKESKILVMDEATASVDHETDLLIQNTIRNELRGCTVLCVAHRLHTIADYDRVVVLVEGRVAEYGTPLELMRSSSSLFRDMCEATGDFDNLLKVARA
jgi:ATP-binding cassette subfamily C (CFTR/MRP) protein 1